MEELPDLPAVAVPTIVAQGAYSIYLNPDGGMVLSYRMAGTDEDQLVAIPPAMMKMAQMMGNNTDGMFSMMRKMIRR